MFTKIAVPLDGSKLAEKALPYATKLASLLNGGLTLIRVAENNQPEAGKAHASPSTVDEYLKEVKKIIVLGKHLKATDIDTVILNGEPVKQLGEYIESGKADMLVMTTHGRGVLPRLLLGSVAAKLLEHAPIPIILIKPANLEDDVSLDSILSESGLASYSGTRLRFVVALDGSPESEAALEPATLLAKQTGGTIFLLQVVLPVLVSDFSGNWYVYDLEEQTNARHEAAAHYLDKIEASLNAQDIPCVKVVREGNPAEEIIDYTRKANASMLVMATHARNSLGQILLGSVANDVVRHTHLPVMLVHTVHHGKNSHKKNHNIATI